VLEKGLMAATKKTFEDAVQVGEILILDCTVLCFAVTATVYCTVLHCNCTVRYCAV
jgi:hypothetical protein